MSMKFFTGLQDLLGLYEAGATTSSPASPIPPTSPSMFPPMTPQSHSSATSVRKKVSDANKEVDEECIKKCSHSRTVKFPEDVPVTGYHEAPVSDFHSGKLGETVEVAEIVAAYREACSRRQCPPSPAVEKQIGYFHKCPTARQEILCLKGERVSHAQMEALEEIFKRVQFNTIDFEYTFLDDDCAISLAEMIEYYDSCTRLNLSFNKQIDVRGWNTLFKAVRNCSSLQMLNLRYTTLNDKSIPGLCRTLRAHPAAALSCLHLENTQMSGKNLVILICALKNNTGIKELYLGDNGLQGTDGTHIYQLITSNSTIQLLDLRNNNLSDAGVRHISDALKNREALEKSALSAIVLWNNHVTGASMDCLAEALKENTKIETLNIGNNKLGIEGIARLKPSIVSNSHLHRLGLQNTDIDCQGAIILAECIADNTALLRVDIRDNPIALAGLLALHSAMKMNRSITLLNIDVNCVKSKSDKVREYQEEFERYFKEIQIYCDRNKEEVMKRMTVTFDEDTNPEAEKNTEVDGVTEQVKDTENDENQGGAKDEKMSQEEDEKLEESNNNEQKMLSKTCWTKKERHQRFARSSSLTCTETVHDIHDRLREMSGSTHSLDAATLSTVSSSAPLDSASNVESMRTIKKKFSVSTSPVSLPLSEWGSLPALPQASPTAAPVVRKLRRFSVSPSSSQFDVTTSPTPPTMANRISSESIPEVASTSPSLAPIQMPTRPTSLAIGIPLNGSIPSGPSSAPVMTESMDLWSPSKERKTPEQEIVNIEPAIVVEEIVVTSKEVNVENDEGLEEACKLVVNDLLNYVEYEENSQVERKASILMKTPLSRPNPEELLKNLETMGASQAGRVETVRTPMTPSRVLEIAEELEGETDDDVVQSVVRHLVRDVLRNEKNELRSTLDRRRRHQFRNSPV